MEKWPLRLCCAFSFFSSAIRQVDHAVTASDASTQVFWAFGGLISLALVIVVLRKGVA